MPIKDVLENFGRLIQKESRERLAKLDKADTGKLGNSIEYSVDANKRDFELSIRAEEYAAYVDQGVKGKTSSSRAPSSPFKFGSGKGKKGGLTEGIDAWVERKRIQFKERKTGRFLSYKATANLITRSVYNKGLKPSGFLTKPFEDEFDKLPKQLVIAYFPEVVEKVKKIMIK